MYIPKWVLILTFIWIFTSRSENSRKVAKSLIALLVLLLILAATWGMISLASKVFGISLSELGSLIFGLIVFGVILSIYQANEDRIEKTKPYGIYDRIVSSKYGNVFIAIFIFIIGGAICVYWK